MNAFKICLKNILKRIFFICNINLFLCVKQKDKKTLTCTGTIELDQHYKFILQSSIFQKMGHLTIHHALLRCAKMLNLKQENVQKGVKWHMMSRRPDNDVIDDTTLSPLKCHKEPIRSTDVLKHNITAFIAIL